MAAVTLLGTQTFTTSSGTKTVTATPAVGDLIVIVTAHTANTSAATPTDDHGGVYVTLVNSKKATSADTLMIHVRTQLISSATSTIFSHAPGSSNGGGLAVLKVTGMTRSGADASKQTGAKQENQGSGGTPAPVFGTTPQSGNPVIGAVFNATSPATITPRSSPAYTERVDVGYSNPTTGLEVMSIDSGETSATITWGGTSASAFCDAVVELDTSFAPALIMAAVRTAETSNLEVCQVVAVVPNGMGRGPVGG